MYSSIRLQAVVEAPYFEGKLRCPGEISQVKPFSMIRLSGEMTYLEIELVFAQLAKYNRIKIFDDKQAVINQILEAETLVLPGGIQVISEGNNPISPSYCCGLETWCEWINFLETGETPWLGHDPSPWLEKQGDRIRIWSDGGFQPVSNAFHIELLRSDFEKALKRIEQDLQAFLLRIER